MATKYLGPVFDIHGGGVDLIFPHHENELAQSTAAGDAFARYWMHNGLLTVNGEKMSKSIGNVVLLSDLLDRARAVEVRYYLGAAHYRSMIDYSDEALRDAATAYRRIEAFVVRAVELAGRAEPSTVPQAFADAMDDDLGVPQALAVVHESVREGNTALAAGDKDALVRVLGELRAMLGVLGIDPLSPQWEGTGGDLGDVVDALVSVALEQREAARARGDYATGDAIRDRLTAAGIVIEDTSRGPRWELKRS
jgi:cysteinyl-tRNA synthetase